MTGGTIKKTNYKLNFSTKIKSSRFNLNLLKIKLVFFNTKVCDYIKTISSSSSFNTYF